LALDLALRDVDLHDVKLFHVVGCATVAAALVGCGGHAITPGKADAAAACHGSGTAAALAATRAAAVNPSYAALAADENALAANASTQEADLSDGTPSDDSGASALAAGVGLGSAAQQKVVADCFDLGLPVASSH
jgi:hypothetical protein